MEEFRFERLKVWQKSTELVERVYKLQSDFPKEERFALCDQIRRAIVSVPSNIAEGTGRASNKEKAHFIEIAYGSLMETFCQIIIARNLKFITPEQVETLRPYFEEVAKMLSGFRTYLQNNN